MDHCNKCGTYFSTGPESTAAQCPHCHADPLPTGEPEDHVMQALYLLQLIQQDLNTPRLSTIWPRAKRALEHLAALEQLSKQWSGITSPL